MTERITTAILRLIDRAGPSSPAVAIVATAPGIAGDIIDGGRWAESFAHLCPDECADYKRAEAELIASYHAMMDAANGSRDELAEAERRAERWRERLARPGFIDRG